MFMNQNEMGEVKVEVQMKDLVELQETAKLYFSVAKERDTYFEEVMKLREKVKELEGKGE